MPRQEYREYLGDKLDDFDHIWKYISNGNKFSEEFGPGKIICLLLQDLGKNQKIAEQAKELFNKSNAMYVSIASNGLLSLSLTLSCSTLYINSPGSGKSATLFTGLTENWGFYFSFADERRDAQTYGYGSRDLSVLLEMMPNHSEWKQATTQAQFEANKKIVQRCIGMLIVVRLAVLLRFLDSVPEDWDPALVRRQWLFIQAAPNLGADGTQPNDIFRALIEALRITTGPDARAVDHYDCVFIARQLWTIIIKKHPRLFPVDNLNKRPFWMAVDEAQRAVQEFLDRFCSDRDPNVRRPILAVIQKIVDDDYDMVTNVVYSGTGLSMRFAHEALSSSALKAGNIFTKNRAGVFDDAIKLGEWFRYFLVLPKLDWMLRPKTNPVHEVLLIRCTSWLPGRFVDSPSPPFISFAAHLHDKYRPRIAAAWCDILLRCLRRHHEEKQPLAVHALFDKYMFQATHGFTVNDRGDEDAGATLSQADRDEIAAVAAAVNWDLVLKLARGSSTPFLLETQLSFLSFV